MRLIPKTMGGQLVATMLLAVMVAHAAAIIVRQLTPDQMHPLAARYMLDRVAGIYHALRLSPDKADEMLASIGSPTARFWLATGASLAPVAMNAAERQQAQALAERLPRAPAPRSWVQLTNHPPGEDGVRKAGMLASVELPDGRWLVGYQQSPGSSPWWRPLHFSVPVSVLPVLLVAPPALLGARQRAAGAAGGAALHRPHPASDPRPGKGGRALQPRRA